MLDQHQWEKRYREELANQLLQGHSEPGSREAMAAYLELDLQQPRIVWLLELYEPQPQALRGLLAELEITQREALITMTSFNELVLLRPACMRQGVWDVQQERKLAQQLQHEIQQRFGLRLIVGGFYSGDEGVYRSIQTARAVQTMAHRLKLPQHTLFYDDYPLPSLLCDLGEDWRAQELSRPWQQLSAQDEKGMLRNTLRHYFNQNCDQTKTAAKLNIHFNTLRYRLQRVEKTTGLKINQLADVLQLYIGMLMQD
jgi:carbohydrate diacid regulator